MGSFSARCDASSCGTRSRALSDFPLNHCLNGCEIFCDGLPSLLWCRTIGSATRRGAESAVSNSRKRWDQAVSARSLGESRSWCSLTEALEKLLPLVCWQEVEESCYRQQQRLWVPVVQVCACEKVGANHFQTV